MKLCLTTWLFYKPLADKTVTPERVFDFFKELGGTGVEVPRANWPDWSDEGVKRLGALAADHGFAMTAVACQNHFNEPDAAKRAEEVRLVKRFVDIAAALDAKVLNTFFAGWGDPAQAERLYEPMLDSLREAVAYAETKRVVLGIEAHGPGTRNNREMRELAERVRSPSLKLVMDSGNVDHPPEEGLEGVMPHACMIHFKSGWRDANGGRHPVDASAFFGKVLASGFDGDVTLESLAWDRGSLAEPKGDLFDEVRAAAAALQPYLE